MEKMISRALLICKHFRREPWASLRMITATSDCGMIACFREVPMLRSVRAFLDQVIDYAGMFPPAKLPFEDALQHYEQVCKRWPHSKLLGGFICPTARLHNQI